MDDFNYENEIIEISDETETLEDVIKKEIEVREEESKPNKKKKRKFKLSKKQTIFLIISIVVFLIVLGIVLFFVLKDDKKVEKEEPTVIVENDNYRYENGKLIFLDKNDKKIGSYDCKNKDTNKCFVTKNDLKTDLFDRVKNVTETKEEIIKNTKIYFNKYVFVTDGNVTYFYNMVDNEKELELNSVKTYNTEKDLVVVEDDKKLYGLLEISEDGYEYLIRCSYDNLGIINPKDELLLAKDKDKQYIIDFDGKKLSSNINAEVKSANKEYIVASINDTYNLFNYDYEELISDYEYISLHDEVIGLVKNKRLYFVNNELNKLYEDGIRLKNSDYIKQYVYDEDNKLIDTKKSYEVEVMNNSLKITIDKDIKEINILEGNISSSLSYMSYFDGKLYLYADEEKVDVLGTYNCNKKNEITSGAATLDNCNIYNIGSKYSGIYNNDLVFIQDVLDNNIVYYLYSLKEKKIKGTYSEIEILNPVELDETVKPVYTSSSFIVAKSATGQNKGNYGVLEINSEKVQGKVGFKYTEIASDKGYYKLTNNLNTISLYDAKFTKISNEFDYIELYDEYYVGITKNKLNVFAYDNKNEILIESIPVSDNKFKIDFTNGFIITVGEQIYTFDKAGKKVVEKVEEPITNGNANTNVEEDLNEE